MAGGFMYLKYEKRNVIHAKQLRKDMTPQEKKLWYCFLRYYPSRFLRQRPAGNYILDFYCASAKLAVELDGGQHYEDTERKCDHKRTEELNAMGVRVIRFTNTQVDREFEAVKEEIDRVVRGERNPPVTL